MNFLKKYFGDPDVIGHLDFTRATPHEFDLDGQKMTFLSPDYACQIPPEGSSRLVKLGESFWKTEYSHTGPYQYLFGNICCIYNQKIFNKERRGTLQLSILLRYRPQGTSLSNFHDLYQHTTYSIAENCRKFGSGPISLEKGKWMHETVSSRNESDFLLLNNNGINWLCGYKLSDDLMKTSFYHTLLNEDVVIELKFSRGFGGGNTTHEMLPDIINVMNAAERNFIRHFKLEPKDNTLAIQNMLAEQYQGKALTLDDIGGVSERALLND